MDNRDRQPGRQEEPRQVAVAKGSELRHEASEGVVHALPVDAEAEGLIADDEMRVMAIRLADYLHNAKAGRRLNEVRRMSALLHDLANIRRAIRGAALTPKEQGNG